jgi:hypothetical protein
VILQNTVETVLVAASLAERSSIISGHEGGAQFHYISHWVHYAFHQHPDAWPVQCVRVTHRGNHGCLLALAHQNTRKASGPDLNPTLAMNSIAQLIPGHTLGRAVHITGFYPTISQVVGYKVLSVDRSDLSYRSLPALFASKYTATMASQQSMDIQIMSDT